MQLRGLKTRLTPAQKARREWRVERRAHAMEYGGIVPVAPVTFPKYEKPKRLTNQETQLAKMRKALEAQYAAMTGKAGLLRRIVDNQLARVRTAMVGARIRRCGYQVQRDDLTKAAPCGGKLHPSGPRGDKWWVCQQCYRAAYAVGNEPN